MAGIMARWSREEYEADKTRVRSTSLKEMNSPQGPRLFYLKHVTRELQPTPGPWDHIQPEIDDLILGTLFHEYLLEQIQNWFVCEHRRGTKAWQDDIEEHSPLYGIKAAQHKQLIGMRDAVMANQHCRKVLEAGGFTEQTFLFDWEPADGGEPIPSKMRADWLASDGSIFDLKTTRFSNRKDFHKQAIDLGYDFSAAFYEMGRNSVPEFEGAVADFYHIVVCKEPPYWAYLWPFDRSWVRIGERKVNRAFGWLHGCRKKQKELESQGLPSIDAWPDLIETHQLDREAAPDWYLSSSGFKPDEF